MQDGVVRFQCNLGVFLGINGLVTLVARNVIFFGAWEQFQPDAFPYASRPTPPMTQTGKDVYVKAACWVMGILGWEQKSEVNRQTA